MSSASKRSSDGAADHGEPPHGMHPHHPHQVCEPSEEKEGSVVTAANHCFGHQRESAGRDRHMGTAMCPTLGRRCSFSVLPPRWRSLANDDGGTQQSPRPWVHYSVASPWGLHVVTLSHTAFRGPQPTESPRGRTGSPQTHSRTLADRIYTVTLNTTYHSHTQPFTMIFTLLCFTLL